MSTTTDSAERAPFDWAQAMPGAKTGAAAALATACAATALSGVIDGVSWLGHIVVTVLLVWGTGLALRSLRAPALVVGLAQLLVLLMLVTGMFTRSGVLWLVPGPTALTELSDVLATAGAEVRTSVPPVEATPAILCLLVIGVGMVAVLVDTLAVSAAAPAASGLVLLTLYAVPASLSGALLPAWSFVLGAASFALLMAVDGAHRHRQGRKRAPASDRSPEDYSAPTAVVTLALVFGLLAGASVSAIGTAGQLPFSDGSGGGGGTFQGGLGIEPFTSLRGMLNQREEIEVFQVRGLDDERRLMRAFTLDHYEPNQGWRLDTVMRHGVNADTPLPAVAGSDTGTERTVEVEPVNWNDVWLPVYGLPKRIDGIDNRWIYDEVSGAVYSERPQRPPNYTVTTMLTAPGADELRDANLESGAVDPVYTEIDQLDPRVDELIADIVAGADTEFDQVTAIWEFFTDGRFSYDTQTALQSDADALVDFLLNGRRGFCEQFASAMAVMVRSIGIPARVAVGFSAGTEEEEGYQSITTHDAHAWVEVYLGNEHGWVIFDPTPRVSGNSVVPPYLETPQDDQAANAEGEEVTPDENAPDEQDLTSPEDQQAGEDDQDDTGLATAPTWVRWSTMLLIVLAGAATAVTVVVARRASEMRRRADPVAGDGALAAASRWLPLATAAAWLLVIALLGWMVSWWLAVTLCVLAAAACAPALIREVRRGSRLYAITMRLPGAPNAAWRELLDDLADRGTEIPASNTARQVANRIAADHDLDAASSRQLRTVVEAIEMAWYGRDKPVEPGFTAAFEEVRRGLRSAAAMSWRDKLLPKSVLRQPALLTIRIRTALRGV